MPSYKDMKRIYSNSPSSVGQQLKVMSDYIMQETWDNDISTRKCYIYDCYHDNEPNRRTDYIPNTESGKIEVDLKFIIKEYKSLSKDDPEYHIEFSPDDWNNNLIIPDYWEENYGKYDIQFPLGMIVDIPDDRGIYSKWIVVTSEVANQFPKFGVIKCNYLFRWIEDDGIHRIKRQIWGSERTQNSYTSQRVNIPSIYILRLAA